MINLPSQRQNLSLKTTQTKTIEKVEQMLLNLQKIKTEQNASTNTARAISRKKEEIVFSKDSDSDTLFFAFDKFVFKLPKVKRFFVKPNPMFFTKNWYSKPTPPDMQFEERFFQTQFSVFANKLYEWNIDGLPEQEIINKMSHMSMVANAYITNHKLDHAEIVDLFTTSFSRTLRSWWEKYLTKKSRESIKKAVKKGDDVLPIFDERIGQGIPDGVNTLIYTIIKHFVGTPSNISSRISDYLNNLRCPIMSDYKWYQDVFIFRVMLQKDYLKPYWKEKLIVGLPSLFSHKVKEELTDKNGIINYDDLTYGDIFSTIKKLGINVCNDQKMLKQQLKNSKKAKYEMGNFCEQYGLPLIAFSRHKRNKKHDKVHKDYKYKRHKK